MKICYVADAIIPSRTANSVHVMRMCDAYSSLGHNVTLVVPRWESTESRGNGVHDYYGVEHGFAIRYVAAPQWKRYESAFYRFILPVVVAWTHPDLIHTRVLAVAWGLTRFLHRRTLLESHQPWVGKERQQTMLAEAANSGHLQGLVVITKALAEHFIGLPDSVPLVVAPDGVASSLLRRNMTKRESRIRIGLAIEKRPIVVYAGHLYRGRGIELIIEMARQAVDHLFLVVGGNDEDIAVYRALEPALHNLRYVGFVPPGEVQQYLVAADVLVMPYAHRVYTAGGTESGQFASPMKMFEYMAAGRPILASSLPVLREVLTDGVNAMLLPYDDPYRWVEALRILQAEPQLADSLGQHARIDVEQYTWERRAQRILDRVL